MTFDSQNIKKIKTPAKTATLTTPQTATSTHNTNAERQMAKRFCGLLHFLFFLVLGLVTALSRVAKHRQPIFWDIPPASRPQHEPAVRYPPMPQQWIQQHKHRQEKISNPGALTCSALFVATPAMLHKWNGECRTRRRGHHVANEQCNHSREHAKPKEGLMQSRQLILECSMIRATRWGSR